MWTKPAATEMRFGFEQIPPHDSLVSFIGGWNG